MSKLAYNISLEDGLKVLDEAFSRTRMIMEGYPCVKLSEVEFQRFYQCVYLLCVQKRDKVSYCNSSVLYQRYKFGLEECINLLVLPPLENKSDASLLTEFVVKWSSYQLMAKRMSRFFSYLDRYYIPHSGLLGLLDLATKCFHNLVDAKCKTKLITAAMSLINQDRNGGKIDRNLLKNVVEYFCNLNSPSKNDNMFVSYAAYDDFEKALLESSAAYYSQFASHGLLHDSYAEYIRKVQFCLNQENERANHFFNLPLRKRLLQVVQSCLVDQVMTKLAEKQAAENNVHSTDYQDLLSKCAELNLQDPGSDRNLNMFQYR